MLKNALWRVFLSVVYKKEELVEGENSGIQALTAEKVDELNQVAPSIYVIELYVTLYKNDFLHTICKNIVSNDCNSTLPLAHFTG